MSAPNVHSIALTTNFLVMVSAVICGYGMAVTMGGVSNGPSSLKVLAKFARELLAKIK